MAVTARNVDTLCSMFDDLVQAVCGSTSSACAMRDEAIVSWRAIGSRRLRLRLVFRTSPFRHA